MLLVISMFSFFILYSDYKEETIFNMKNVEHHLETAFICAFKGNYECEAPNIACQFLGEDNKCMCENACTYQKKTDGRQHNEKILYQSDIEKWVK